MLIKEFEEQVKRTPYHIAVMTENRTVSYAELNKYANRIAHSIKFAASICTEDQETGRVGLLLEHGLDMIAAILGTLKAGKAYIPLSPDYPLRRISYMLENSESSLLITNSRNEEKANQLAGENSIRLLNLDKCNEDIPGLCIDVNPAREINGERLAYILYTSGSTGKPKGVMQNHQNVLYFIRNWTQRFSITDSDRMILLASFCHDGSIPDIYSSLLNGATLFPYDVMTRDENLKLSQFLIQQKITIWHSVPSLYNFFINTLTGEENFQHLRYILLGGEPLRGHEIEMFKEHFPGAMLANIYGQTESTVNSIWTVRSSDTVSHLMIGSPLDNTQLFVVDGEGNEVDLLETGEIMVACSHISPGYWKNDELTKKSFSLDPEYGPIYWTGDVGRLLPEGNIEFLGRKDSQVKIRGFRVEPGEIETTLLQMDDIKEAVVVAKESGTGNTYLCAFFVAVKELNPSELRIFLSGDLPNYMIPLHFIQLEKMPLTQTGKIDRKSLSLMEIGPLKSSSIYIEPGTTMEKTVARVWEEVLNLEAVGLHDNIFEIGGNSFDIIKINSKLSELLQKNIPTVKLFEYPTIEDLAGYLTQLAENKESGKENQEISEPVKRGISVETAVIGMAGRFPGAKNIDVFWENLKNGIESISFFSEYELITSGLPSELVKKPNYIKAKGMLDDIEFFDAGFFNFTPKEATIMDPQLRIFHECAWEALENAGYSPFDFDAPIGIYSGNGFNFDWLVRVFTKKNSPIEGIEKGFLNNHFSTYISYKLDLRGPSVTIRTACSTSLVAVHEACKGLLLNECDMALAGGVSILTPKKSGYLYHEGMIYSSDGHVRAFDIDANGTIFGDGVGCVVLKRLKDAIAAGDYIYAVIKGSAVNNDGIKKVGYSAPSISGLREVVRAAQIAAGVEPENIGFIETHGTGTILGDAVEIGALNQVFPKNNKKYCALGSVKTNVGHLNIAAGITGFVKTVLCLAYKQIPPTLHFKTPNPEINFENSPFYINTTLVEWKKDGYPLKAGVSSFGIGGTNAHVVLEEAPVNIKHAIENREYRLMLLSAATGSALDKITENLVGYFTTNPSVNLSDAAYTLQAGRHAFPHRRMVVCKNANEAARLLTSHEPGKVFSLFTKKGKPEIIFMFPGQGSQYVNMGLGLYKSEPMFREEMGRCFDLLKPLMNLDIKEILYPSREEKTQEMSEILNQAGMTQSVLFVIEYALSNLLIKWGIKPCAMIGQGFGEYTAACLSGVLSLEDALTCVVLSGKLIQEIPKNAMAFKKPSIPFISNVTGTWISPEDALNPHYWAMYIRSAVRFAEGLEEILKKPDTIFMEVGPGRTLSTFVNQHKEKKNGHLVINLIRPPDEDIPDNYYLLNNIGRCWLHGMAIDWKGFYENEKRWRIPLPTYPFERKYYWIENDNSAVYMGKHVEESETRLAGESPKYPRPGLSSPYTAPATETERKLALIWQDLFGFDKIGINDDFFELGGDSLKAIVIVHKIQENLGIQLSLNNFFANLTIKVLAEHIKDQLTDSESQAIKQERKVKYSSFVPDPTNIHRPFPLTHIQAAYLSGRSEQFDIGGISTHVYLEIEINLDIQRFNESLNKLIARHPMMRAIVTEDGEQQILEETPRYELNVEDLILLDNEQQHKRILKERERMSHNIFNLNQWPLFEIKCLQLSEKKHYLLVGIDMVMMDGHSFRIIFKELTAFYMNPSLELPPLEFTYRDYLLAVGKIRDSDIYAADKEYWLNKLEEFPTAPQLPMICKPSEIKKPTFLRFHKLFPKEEWQTLQDISRKNSITPSVLLLTAYAQVLAYWSNQNRFALNLTLFNRFPFHEDVAKIVGNFTSIILLTIDWYTGCTFIDVAGDIQQTLMEALEHRHYDGIEFIREISRYKDLLGQAVMPVVFTSITEEESETDSKPPSEPDETAVIKWRETQTSQVFIEVHARLGRDQLILDWDFVEELFDPISIGSIFEQYIDIITALIKNDTKYKLIPPQRDRLLWENYNQTAVEIPGLLLQQMFEHQAALTPDNIALEYRYEALTYRQLNEKSNQVAAYLKEQGVSSNILVGILTTRSFETMIYVMGVLKAGGAYVPIDHEYPQERCNYIYKDAGCRLLLKPDLYIKEGLARYPSDPVENVNIPQDLAYVIYTSGSTGKPKGVAINHQEVTNTIIDINRKFQVNDTDSILGISSMCFDLSVYDVFGTLSTGARLVLIPTQKDIDVLFEALDTKRITFWNSVPAILNMVVKTLEDDYVNPYLQWALLSGDWIPLALPAVVCKHFPNCRVISLGGATEGAIWSIYYPIQEIKKEWNSIPYGYPLSNQSFYVLNDHMQLCPVGVPGELYIGGMGVAEGYLNDVEKTSYSYCHHYDFGRLYRTGDQGAFHKDGYIKFLGRKDHQVKIRGYRVELGEIESCLLEHQFVKSAIVVDRINPAVSEGRYLGAYVVLNHTGDNTNDQTIAFILDDLKDFLSKKLPNYMVPSFFIPLQEFPLTANGKIDYKHLPEPKELKLEKTSQYIAPRNPVELKQAEIWGALLNRELISINDNFFMLGGDSIKAIQLIAQLKKIKLKLELKDLFKYATIKELTNHIKHLQEIPPQGIVEGDIKLTPIQKWFFERNFQAEHHFNQSVMLHKPERFQEEIIRNVFSRLMKHHDALRIVFKREDGKIRQVNRGAADDRQLVDLEVFDIPGENDFEDIIREKCSRVQSSINLDEGPLIKLALFNTIRGDYLLIAIHHLVFDGLSWRLLFEGFISLYQQIENGVPEQNWEIPLKTNSYKEWAEKLYQYSNSPQLLKELDYWKNIEETETPTLVKNKTNKLGKGKDNRQLFFELSEVDTEKLLKQTNSAYNTEINDILLTALGLAVNNWAGITGVTKIPIILEGHGREEIIPDIDITRTVGWFTSIFPVVLDLKNKDDISSIIKDTKEMLRRVPFKGIGYGILKYLTKEENKKGIEFRLNPEINFNYLGQFDEDINTGLFQIANISPGNSISLDSERIYPLSINGMVSGKKLRMALNYDINQFDKEEIRSLIDGYKNCLKRIIDHCVSREKTELTLSDLSAPIENNEAEVAFDILDGITLNE